MNETFFLLILIIILLIAIPIAIFRWIFRVNHIVNILERIDGKLERIAAFTELNKTKNEVDELKNIKTKDIW
jgi:methyl-accepting chemotaxis protein